jgi:hypothetical protein
MTYVNIKVEMMKPRRVQIVAADPIGARYFKHGQFAYVIGSSDEGGMFWIDRPGCSKKGEVTYLISKSKGMAGGALWISADGVRFTSKGTS